MHAICWTLIHSLWQGVLAAVLAGIVIMGTQRSPVILRYRGLAACLLLFVLGVGVTFCYQLNQGANNMVTRAVYGGNRMVARGAMQTNNEARPNAATPNAATPNAATPNAATSNTATPLSNAIPASPAAVVLQPVVNYLNTHAVIVVDIWLICLFLQLIRLMGGLYTIRRVRRSGLPLPAWDEKLASMASQLGIKRRVALLESAFVKVPAAVGTFKPLILVPLGVLSNLPADQVLSILLHELAHIKRGDYLTNLLLHITGVLFFFNPGLRWLNALIRRERESCCDDMVLSVMDDRSAYFDALIAFREYMIGRSVPAYAVALGSGRNSLLWRIRRMLKQENKTLDIMEKTILSFGLAVVITAGLLSMKPAPAGAQLAAPAAIAAPAEISIPAEITMPAKMAVSGAPAEITMSAAPTAAAKDTVPSNKDRYDRERRSDSLRKRKAEVEEAELAARNGADTQAMKMRMEELALKNALLADAMKNRMDELAVKNAQFAEDMAKKNEGLVRQQQALADSLSGSEVQITMSGDVAKLFNEQLRSHSSDRTIDMIISRLKAQQLIDDETNMSFNLDQNALVVNGKTQPAEVHQKFKEIYIRSPKDHFTYTRHGGMILANIYVDKE